MNQETIERIRKFTEDRDWDQFYSPANLAKLIVIEAAELLGCFRWSDKEYDLRHVKEELADVLQMLKAEMAAPSACNQQAMGVLRGNKSGEDKRIIPDIAVHGMRKRCAARICPVLSGNWSGAGILSN